MEKVSQSFENFEKKKLENFILLTLILYNLYEKISFFKLQKNGLESKKVITVFVIIIKVIHKKGI